MNNGRKTKKELPAKREKLRRQLAAQEAAAGGVPRVRETPGEIESKYRSIFELCPQAIVVLDKRGNVLDVNGRLYDWLGYCPEEVIGKNMTELPYLTGASRKIAREQFLRRMRGEEIPPYELEFTPKAGGRRIGRILGTPVRNETGQSTVDIILIDDVTERKDAEDELRGSEERYRNLFDIAPVGIFLLDLEGNITAVNNRGIGIYGYTREELLNLNVRDIVPRKIAGNFPRLVRDVRKKKSLFFESEGKRKDRKIFPLALSANIFKWGGKEFVQVVVQDLSDRKAAENSAQLRRLSEKLFKYQEEERKHIARELHDHIGQDLAAIKIGLQMLEKEYRLEPGLRRELKETVKIAEKTIADVRRISSTLRPESLDRMGLLPP